MSTNDFESLLVEVEARYNREYDYYLKASALVSQILEGALTAEGIKCIVSHRAKDPLKLSEKVTKRNNDKRYKSSKEIFEDIVDLSGVRIALYFPNDREKVKKIIEGLFQKNTIKEFPIDREQTQPNSTNARLIAKKFSGYGATHYRIILDERVCNDLNQRYLNAAVEIQIASLLMHAWSEVEHDLIYKPESGIPSSSEQMLLDQINGLVMAGEIALTQLQEAKNLRLSNLDTPFKDHFDLAFYLRTEQNKRQHDTDNMTNPLGDIATLYEYIKNYEVDTPSKLLPYLDKLDWNSETNSIATKIQNILTSYRPQNMPYDESKAAEGLNLNAKENLIARKKRQITLLVDLDYNYNTLLKRAGFPNGMEEESFSLPQLIDNIVNITGNHQNIGIQLIAIVSFMRDIKNNTTYLSSHTQALGSYSIKKIMEVNYTIKSIIKLMQQSLQPPER